MVPRNKIKKITRLLNRAYGKQPPFRKSAPIDELIRTVLSQNTTDKNSLPAYRVLKRHFKSWDSLLSSDVKWISHLIRSSGLANIKAKRIKGILSEITRREGRLSLSALEDLNLGDALGYLRSLEGVGPKTAACVLLFSFGKAIMPVDTHIFRVTKRLGIIGEKLNIEEAHEILSRVVPKGLIYEFHLGIIEHGRRTCKAQNPRCGFCALYNLCKFEHKSRYKKNKPCLPMKWTRPSHRRAA